ncbi:RNA polymerase II subunit B1 CTD phosphatase Rpap2 isoform X2 [Rattus norvegicus]|uniref:RNA polymerase II subunit B1 CTD phosphatase Rpap2 isoform X2 n=1 Tax=Rattus norvegicus TaxID=10116 RepID=UPI0004E48BAE|nr:RNA polymerase II subunit B1 CTD phosphatase Rpap2 isoform X2 [Rattus norvegicus]|eukprot:XP_008768151.1 PREDICTED: RNA polymerase II subunit B1 CTD phosphatase Rpap2 isoform X2 [Rattus norvegicus]
MADSAVPYSLGPSARASSTHRVATGTNKSLFPGTKQTSALKRRDASKRQAELEAALQRKVESERRAVRLVEQLLEENITEEFLKECGMFITPAHYSDVVDERAIIKLCGYPLCQKKLGVIPKQKYRISTKTNKVYDITERKSFCSNFCYKASKFFEAQIPKTPVWVREEERPPEFQLLKKGQSGCSGEVVQFFRDAVTAADVDAYGAFDAQCEPASSSTWSERASDERASDEEGPGFVSSLLPGNRPKAVGTKPQPHRQSSTVKKKAAQKMTSKHGEQTVSEVTEQLSNCRLDSQEKVATCKLPAKKENTQISSPGPLCDRLNTSTVSENKHSVSQVTLVGISKKSAEHFRSKFAKSNPGSGSASGLVQVRPEVAKANLLRVLKDTLTEWKTDETLKFLYGQDHGSVCLQPSAASGPDEELDEDDISCQAQNTLDETLPFRGSDTAIKPLPSYESLKKETEMLNLRVREFYRGRCVLNEDSTKSQDSKENELQRDPSFPLIDSSSQNQIRRRIVLEKLSKVLPGLLGPLQITMGDIYTELKNLVQTFRLTPILGIQKHSPKNVVFTQFIATLLTELHLKCEDLENLAMIFRTSC